MMLRGTQGMVNKIGHYNMRGLWDGSPQLGRLGDEYCDIGYYYDPGVDNCVPMQENSSVCDSGWTWDTSVNGCVPIGGGGGTIVASDGGNAQVWQQIINSVGQIATAVVRATSTQYQTRYGTYAYGTGPYSGLTPTLAQQYLASRSPFGSMNTTTMLLIGGGLLLVLMAMKR